MRLAILHETTYDYRPAVETAHHVAHLRPLHGPTQQLISHLLSIDPGPTDGQLSERIDAFGNTVTQWQLTQVHQRLRVRASSVVQTLTLPDAHDTAPWTSARELLAYRSGQASRPEAAFVFASHHAAPHVDFADYARPDFGPDAPLQAAALALSARMHRELRYESQSTDVHTPARQALRMRRGVCQDFAHILLACLRSQGLAARYVSGYLLTQPPEGQARLIGSDASHAWVALWVPGQAQHASGGWLHLDPTNDRWGWGSPGEDYVQLASGRDFADVSPLRGVLQGGTSHHPVVAVTVTPQDEPA